MTKVLQEVITSDQYGKCVKLSNKEIEIVITCDFGPRIIRAAFIGGENHFAEDIFVEKKVNKETWKLIGGHRLWHSPEAFPRTYMPDYHKVSFEWIKDGVKLIQRTEDMTQIQKEMEIKLSPTNNKVVVKHTLVNKSLWPIEMAVWSLSVMNSDGFEVIPQGDRDKGMYTPNRNISLWKYTKMNDPRVTWGENYIILRQDKNIKNPFKIGINDEKAWAAYFNHNELFVKKFTHYENEKYPDGNCSYETYTNDLFLEMECLSPLKIVNPDEKISNTEEWYLYRNISINDIEELQIQEALKGIV